MAYHDTLYNKRDGIATITINRPKVLNAFRAETVEEMLAAMRDAEGDPQVGVIVLAGGGANRRAARAGAASSACGSRNCTARSATAGSRSLPRFRAMRSAAAMCWR